METQRNGERVTGTRAEIIAELRERADHWHHMASDRKRDRALAAAYAIENGAGSTQVGMTTYVVDGAADNVPEQSYPVDMPAT